MNKFLKIHTDDNVCVAIREINSDEKFLVDGTEVTIKTPVDIGHKFSIRSIPKGNNVIRHYIH